MLSDFLAVIQGLIGVAVIVAVILFVVLGTIGLIDAYGRGR